MDIQYHVSYEALGHMILYIQVQLNTFDTIILIRNAHEMHTRYDENTECR